jgi:hypothetical protein
LRIISRAVDGAGALAGNTHGVAGSATGIDDDTEDDGEDEIVITLSLKLPSTTGADATPDRAFATLFFFADDGDDASDGDGATLAFAAASSPPASGPIAASDDDAPLSVAKRSPSEMVSTPAVFIPSALLIAEG